MSDDNDNNHPIAASVRPAAPGQPPFTLVPLISDILRTRYCVPGSIFLVEGIQAAPVSKSGRWQAIQLLLGDGDLCIQALLGGPLQRFVETAEISVGCYVRVEQSEFRRTTVGGGGGGGGSGEEDESHRDMVYLAVEDLVTVGWNDAYRAMWQAQTGQQLEELAAEHDLDLEEGKLEYAEEEAERSQMDMRPEPSKPANDVDGHGEDDDDDSVQDAFDAFDALTFPPKPPRHPPPPKPAAAQQQPIALPQDWHNHQTPLKLTTLRSIPNLPYPQNWSCNVLAIVVSLSPVEPSYLPPHRQRTARLADPSTSKRVHLTVFLDPEEFEPRVGSAVLLVGVKNHHFDGGSLKKYASDKGKKGGSRWWFEDPWELGWCDVDGIKRWWAEVQSSTSSLPQE